MRRRDFIGSGVAAGLLAGLQITDLKAQQQSTFHQKSPLPSHSLAQEDDHRWWSNKVDPNYHNAPATAVEAWNDRKFGMRIHWGTYSVLGLDASWPLQGSSKEFQDIYSTLYQVFNPTDFEPDQWAELAVRAGMKYFVFTTRHCDGFSMFDTKTEVDSIRRIPDTNPDAHNSGIGATEKCRIHYSIMDTPYPKDIVAEVVRAFRTRDLGVGLYYSWWDWHDPDAQDDPRNLFHGTRAADGKSEQRWQRFIDRIREQIRELCSHYGELFEISFDTGLPEAEWKQTVGITEMARSLQPSAMFRERGIGPYGDFTSPEHWVPDDPLTHPLEMPWEAIETLGSRWAYLPNDRYKSKEWLLGTLIDVVAKGGNFMPGVSPMANGQFPRETIERLEYVGAWLRVNGEAIYGTRSWNIFKEGEQFRFTRSKDGQFLYAIALQWPGRSMMLRSVRALQESEVMMLGVNSPLRWTQNEQGLVVDIPEHLGQQKPCSQAYVFKIRALPYEKPAG